MTPVLNEMMSFDHVIRVHANGTATHEPKVWAPELLDGELSEYKHIPGQPTGWRLMNGYSGQSCYAGPIMHSSEFVGGRMERDILARPGLYVALTSGTSTPDSECEDCRPECEGHESLAGEHMGEAVYCDGSCRPKAENLPCEQHDINGWAVAYIEDGEE